MKLDETAYALALSRARTQLQLSIAFDPSAHPRDWKGQFKKSLTGMQRGDVRETPSGVKIERKYKGFRVTGPDGSGQSFSSLDQATDSLMMRDAKTTHEKSIGGAKSTTLEQAKKEAKGSVEPKAIRAAMETMSLQDNHLLDNQLERVRESILDTVDPANKPPAKDGAEALKRLKAGEGSYNGRGSSWIPSLNGPHDEARIWKAILALRGK